MQTKRKKRMKKISIIIPAYNCESYIGRCIDSLLRQEGAELEIIAVNDGSTDNTYQKLLEYKDKIIVRNIENSGAANARNIGLVCASGDFVMFVDSDDYLADGAIRRLIDVQAEEDADIVHFRYECVYSDGAVFVPDSQINRDVFVRKKEFKTEVYPLFLKGIYLNSVCMAMYKREVIHGTQFRTDLVTAEDAVFSAAAFTAAKSVKFVSDIIYKYYQSNEGLTGRGISVLRKYHDNFVFAAETAGYLKRWRMNTPLNYIRAYLRPVIVTFDKIGRLCRKKGKEVQR